MESTTRLDRSLSGRVAIVTGAGNGIGRATAQLLAREGAFVAVTGRAEKNISEVSDGINRDGGKARHWLLDVGDAAAIKHVVNDVAAHFGRLDIIVNNAGISTTAKFDDENFDEVWERALNILLTAPQRVARAALPYLRKSDAGRIVNIGSTDSIRPIIGAGPYGVAKAGLLGLTRVMATEFARHGITANCVNPGLTHTALNANIPDDEKQAIAKRLTLLRRWASAEEIADAIVNLCRPSAGYITGSILNVDGGWTSKGA